MYNLWDNWKHKAFSHDAQRERRFAAGSTGFTDIIFGIKLQVTEAIIYTADQVPR